MKGKQLAIALIVAVVLGAAGWYVLNQRSASWQSTGKQIGHKLVPDFPLNDVATIRIADAETTLVLEKKEDQWRVAQREGYPADFGDISEFLRNVWDIKVVQNQPVGPSHMPRLKLLPPDTAEDSESAGTLVEFKNDEGKTINRLLLGKQHMQQQETPSPYGGGSQGWPDGRYVLVLDDGAPSEEEATRNVALVSEPFSTIEPDPQQWLDKEFFKVQKIQSVAVSHPEETNSWTLTREEESGKLSLANPKEDESLDSSKTSSIANALSSPSFRDVIAKQEEADFEKPVVAHLKTFEGFEYEVKIGQPNEEDYYPLQVKVSADLPEERTPAEEETEEDKEELDQEFEEKQKQLQEKLAKEQKLEGWTYLVSKWTIDPILKTRQDLLEQPEEESAESGTGDATPTDSAGEFDLTTPILPDGLSMPIPDSQEQPADSEEQPAEPEEQPAEPEEQSAESEEAEPEPSTETENSQPAEDDGSP